MSAEIPADSGLRYLEGSKVTSPLGQLGGRQLRNTSDDSVGTLDGVIVDPVERKLRYFVVESRGWFRSRRYLLPACPAQIDEESRSLRLDVDSDDLEACREFDSASFQPFSDDDVIAAVFARHAA